MSSTKLKTDNTKALEDDATKELHSQITDSNVSALVRYQNLVVGSSSIWYLIKFELIVLLFGSLPGALGVLLRKYFYPKILGSVGKNVIIGRNLTIRHGLKIDLSDNVVLDDNVTLDAKGFGGQRIFIGADCVVSRNSTLACKNASILVGEHCSLGINTLIHAAEGSNVSLGDYVLVGANSYLIGGGTYRTEDLEQSFKEQGFISKGGITIDYNVWIGSNSQVLDGCSVGTGCIVGASSVVNKSVDAYDIVAGVPIRVIRSRKDSS